MYLSSQLFFKTFNKTLKFQEKYILQQSADLNFKIFPLVSTMGPLHGTTELNQQKWTIAVDKSAWIKA